MDTGIQPRAYPRREHASLFSMALSLHAALPQTAVEPLQRLRPTCDMPAKHHTFRAYLSSNPSILIKAFRCTLTLGPSCGAADLAWSPSSVAGLSPSWAAALTPVLSITASRKRGRNHVRDAHQLIRRSKIHRWEHQHIA